MQCVKAPWGLLTISQILYSCSGQSIVALGDSFLDIGVQPPGGKAIGGFSKWVQETLQTQEVYPASPYVGGRYCNGPIWIEDVQLSLDLPLLGFAASGSTSGVGLSVADPLPNGAAGYPGPIKVLSPNLFQQLDLYHAYLQTSRLSASPSDIFVIDTGINDYISTMDNNKTSLTSNVIQKIQTALTDLYQDGARRFLLVTIVPPQAYGSYFLQDSNAATNWEAHNPALTKLAADFQSSNSGVSVNVFDLGSIGQNMTQNPQAFGLSTNTSCYTASTSTVCSDPDQHVLWDSIHFTTAAQSQIATAFLTQLGSQYGSGKPSTAG